jgi:hypothetical protein
MRPSKPGTSRKSSLHPREEQFLTRGELGARWKVSLSELHNKEKAGVLKPFHFSYKIVRYRLSDILAIEEIAAQAD